MKSQSKASRSRNGSEDPEAAYLVGVVDDLQARGDHLHQVQQVEGHRIDLETGSHVKRRQQSRNVVAKFNVKIKFRVICCHRACRNRSPPRRAIKEFLSAQFSGVAKHKLLSWKTWRTPFRGACHRSPSRCPSACGPGSRPDMLSTRNSFTQVRGPPRSPRSVLAHCEPFTKSTLKPASSLEPSAAAYKQSDLPCLFTCR